MNRFVRILLAAALLFASSPAVAQSPPINQYGTGNWPPECIVTPTSYSVAAGTFWLPACTATGALQVNTSSGGSTAAPGYTRVQDGTTSNLAFVSSSGVLAVAPCSVALTCQTFLGAGQDALNNTLTAALAAGENYAYNGTTWDRQRTMTAITGSGTGVLAVGQEPQTPTYTATSVGIANAGAGVIFEITGAASHVIRVRACAVSGVATAVGYTTFIARVLSSVDSGGTAGTAPTVGSVDSANAATAATAVAYTTSPTQGTVQTAAIAQQSLLQASTPVGTSPPVLNYFDFNNIENAQPPTLRSASQQFVIFSNTANAGATYSVSCKFTDTST